MTTTTINENQRGLMFRRGRFERLLEPGRYRVFGSDAVEALALDEPISSAFCPIETLLNNETIAVLTDSVRVADGQLALHFADGNFAGVLEPGKYAFFHIGTRHEFRIVDTSEPEIDPETRKYIDKIPSSLYLTVSVAEYEKARLYYDNRLVRLLDGGVYYFWNGSVQVGADKTDMRLTQLTVNGQELLTSDKVTLRVSFICNYRIIDPVKALCEVDDFREQLHVAAQLALRDYVGRRTLDDILQQKEQLSEYVGERLAERAKRLYVEISDAGVKDIILPGEIRDIMNTVLMAEKRAQANVITRREEVASTRSLLNTAKLMDENRTLYRLKELEHIEKICEQVGSITLNGSGDILGQLSALLNKNAEKSSGALDNEIDF